MKIDAIVNDPFVGCTGYVKVPVDIDYVESNEQAVRDWIADELVKRYPSKDINYSFEVENMNDIIEDIKFDEFQQKTN